MKITLPPEEVKTTIPLIDMIHTLQAEVKALRAELAETRAEQHRFDADMMARILRLEGKNADLWNRLNGVD